MSSSPASEASHSTSGSKSSAPNPLLPVRKLSKLARISSTFSCDMAGQYLVHTYAERLFGGPGVMSSVRAVAREHDPGAERAAVDERQFRDAGCGLEQPRSAPQHDWVDEQPVLIDQTQADQLVYQRDAAGHSDLV